MLAAIGRMINWSHDVAARVTRLSRISYRVVAPELQDVATKIKAPCPQVPLSLPETAVGAQRVGYVLPAGFDDMQAPPGCKGGT